jgi:hypothetical protein
VNGSSVGYSVIILLPEVIDSIKDTIDMSAAPELESQVQQYGKGISRAGYRYHLLVSV